MVTIETTCAETETMPHNCKNLGQPDLAGMAIGQNFETLLDHSNLCVCIKWRPERWSEWVIELVIGLQADDAVEIYMVKDNPQKRAKVRVISCILDELQGALADFFTDLNDPCKEIDRVLNLDRQPCPIISNLLKVEIIRSHEIICQSQDRGEILRARHLRRL
jgi:hypothetical protein